MLIIIVITAGKLSGIAATLIATAVKKASITSPSCFKTISNINVIVAMKSTIIVIILPTNLIFF